MSLTRIQNFVDGAYIASGGRNSIEDVDPATGKVHALVDEATDADVDDAVRAARRALKGPWARLSPNERAAALRRIADEIEARFDEFLDAEIKDTGKPTTLASHLDIPRGAANFRAFADVLTSHASEFFAMKTPDGADAINYTLRAPKGVVAVVCPGICRFC